MIRQHNKELVPTARILRKNMTKEERKLWYDFLRDYSVKFTRQKILGNYIVDFYCPKLKLAIELDGSFHYEDINIEKDNERTKFLETNYGVKVIRIPNNNYIIENFSGVREFIDNIVKQSLSQLR